jgi:hypothetical protein
MAFLDNSGDIILDAVLTDTGRMRLAQGDGSFKISKFALGDDEINYGVYNSSHASGSAYYDLEILQTPVLEAFTNNASSLKTKLLSISRTNILYMPVLKLNKIDAALVDGSAVNQTLDSRYYSRDAKGSSTLKSMSKFVVAVDKDTYDVFVREAGTAGLVHSTINIVDGSQQENAPKPKSNQIRVDQGFDTDAIPPTLGIDSDLYESSYIIEMDYRLGRIRPATSAGNKSVNFIDDDNMASYYVSDATYIQENTQVGAKVDVEGSDPQVFKGPRGSSLQFGINASPDLQSSTYLFSQIGTTEAIAANTFGLDTGDSRVTSVHYIDTTVRVIGANTGYRLDLPVRYVKIEK